MNWFYAVLFDYPFVIMPLLWGMAYGLWRYSYYRLYWGGVYRLIAEITVIILAVLGLVAPTWQLGNEVVNNPIQTHYYIHEYQGKDERVAFCFKRFDTQQNMGYSEFMQKCFADDWERHRYENLPK